MSIGITAIGTLPRNHAALKNPVRFFESVADLAAELFAPFFSGARIAEDHALLQLFPSAAEVSISLDEDGAVEFEATTSPIGAGYHMLVAVLIEGIQKQLGVQWSEVSDDTEFYQSKNDDRVRKEFIGWSRGLANAITRDPVQSDSGISVCMGMGVYHKYPAPFLTPFGPVSATDMRLRAESDVAAAAWMPWMDAAPDASTVLAAAKSLLWCDVVWRAVDPEDAPDAEGPPHRAMMQALDLLEAAYELDPELEYPWHEWLELLEIAEEERPLAAEVRVQAGSTPEPDEPIGYRRHDMMIMLPFGATITVPGELTHMLTDEAWMAAGGSCSIHITPYVANEGSASRPKTATEMLDEAWESFMSDFEGEDVGEPFTFSNDASVGRAVHRVADPDEGEDEPTYLTQGLVALPGSFLFCTMLYQDPSGSEWAERCFRSISLDAPGDDGDGQADVGS
ncbi:MAG: hypothetical protein KIT19_05835 [Phycisphaeraceae bacterium]|nr:hypothetical protein [Phycisphaeraceae bacterium]